MSEKQSPGCHTIGSIRERYAHNDTRRIFLNTDNLRKWDRSIFQRFPQPETMATTGLEPGPPGACDARESAIFGSVLVENGLFRMWYYVMPDAESYAENVDHSFAAYAESDDGIHWRKPDLRLTGQHRYPGNHLLPLPAHLMSVVPALPGTGAKYLAACVQIQPLEPDITQGVSNFVYNGGGTYLFASDDGFHWRQLTEQPLIIHGDCCALVADHATGRYFLYQKAGCVHGLDARRSFIGLESTDGIHWEGYEGIATWRRCFAADDYDDFIAVQHGLRIADHYTVAVHRVGDLYVGVESLFLIGDPLVSYFGQNPNGLACLRLAYSDNAMHWRHPKGRPSWLEQGPPGERDAGFLITANTFIERRDESLLYYTTYRYQHGWYITPDFRIDPRIPLAEQRDMSRIRVARIKRDRFASLGAPYQGCFDVENTTCMERTSGRRHLVAGPRGGDELRVNARCPAGQVRVALFEHGKSDSLPGFSLDDCIPFTGDSVRGPIRYKQASVDRIPPDMGLSLRFEITRGEIFGYEWRNPGPASD